MTRSLRKKSDYYWHAPSRTEKVIAPPDGTQKFLKAVLNPSVFDDHVRNPAEARMLMPPMNPGQKPIIDAAYNYVAVGTINILNYDDYAWADPEVWWPRSTTVTNKRAALKHIRQDRLKRRTGLYAFKQIRRRSFSSPALLTKSATLTRRLHQGTMRRTLLRPTTLV